MKKNSMNKYIDKVFYGTGLLVLFGLIQARVVIGFEVLIAAMIIWLVIVLGTKIFSQKDKNN